MPPRRARAAAAAAAATPPPGSKDYQPTRNKPSTSGPPATTRTTRSAARRAAEAEQKAKPAAAAGGSITATRAAAGSSAESIDDPSLDSKASCSPAPPPRKGKAKKASKPTTKAKPAATLVEEKTTANLPKKRTRQSNKVAAETPAAPEPPAAAKQILSPVKKNEFRAFQLSSPPAEVELDEVPVKAGTKYSPKRSAASVIQNSTTKPSSSDPKAPAQQASLKSVPTIPISPAKESLLAGKESQMVSRSKTKRAREEDVLTQGDANIVELSPSKPKRHRTTSSKISRSVNSKFNEQICKKWFESYADPEANVIDTPKAIEWFEELGISIGCCAYYVLAYKLGAKTLFTITKEEFIDGMKKLNVDSNEKLKLKLSSIISEFQPSHNSDQFRGFYRFCFEYIKSGEPTGSKNIPLDPWAVEFLSLTLDKKKYSIDYKPPEEEAGVNDTNLAEKGDEDFPHLHAFRQFLQVQKPVKVITKDQWDCFLPFNKSVGWDFEGYDEAESSWPSLFDQYIEWKKKMSSPKAADKATK